MLSSAECQSRSLGRAASHRHNLLLLTCDCLLYPITILKMLHIGIESEIKEDQRLSTTTSFGDRSISWLWPVRSVFKLRGLMIVHHDATSAMIRIGTTCLVCTVAVS